MKRIINYFLTITFLGLFLSCGSGKDKTQMGGEMAVDVANPEIDSVMLYKDYPGYLASEVTVNLVARVNGVIQKINYNPGDVVKQGQILFVIEPTNYQDLVSQAQAQLATAKSQYEYAKNNYESMKEAAVSNAVSQIDLKQAQANMAQAKASIDNADAALRTAQTNLSYCYVRAPFTGTISKNTLDVGNFVSGATQAQTLATIYDNTKLYAYFSIEDAQYMKMVAERGAKQKGIDYSKIPITFSQPLNYKYTGKLDYLSPNIQLSTGTLNLRAKVENKYNELKDGMYVTVNMPYEMVPKAILIKDASIGTDQLGKYVFVVNDSNKVVYTPIQIGSLFQDTLRVVNSGLTAKDKYVTKALLKVREGMTVKPVMTK